MESSTTIGQMLAGGEIFVPTYQRAYSWDTAQKDRSESAKQVDVFLSDLEEYVQSGTASKYYFGHFLFENHPNNRFGVIDGQQRLTTIVIFLSALFKRLREMRGLTDEENFAYMQMIKMGSKCRFHSLDYDDRFFEDYVIDQKRKDHANLDTISQTRMAEAFNFFVKKLSLKNEPQLLALLTAVKEASCSTHVVSNESEAIQMFIFQNNRGKRPSNLEIIKAQFMFHIHLRGGEEKELLINEIRERFEGIYKSIARIEHSIDEDDVLLYTQKVYFNSLWEGDPMGKVNAKLSETDSIEFIKDFSFELESTFKYLMRFFKEDQSQHIEIESLVYARNYAITLPFVVKAYKLNLPDGERLRAYRLLESIVMRDRIVSTRADLTARLNERFQKFGEEPLEELEKHISWMKTIDNYYWGHWNDNNMDWALQGPLRSDTAKLILWRYENHLRQTEEEKGYPFLHYDEIESPQLEHIAPQSENHGMGYPRYTDKFKETYLDCLGNYLLLSGAQNLKLSNRAFKDKRATYTQLCQQREVQAMTAENERWTVENIKQRMDKIIAFVKSIY